MESVDFFAMYITPVYIQSVLAQYTVFMSCIYRDFFNIL